MIKKNVPQKWDCQSLCNLRAPNSEQPILGTMILVWHFMTTWIKQRLRDCLKESLKTSVISQSSMIWFSWKKGMYIDSQRLGNVAKIRWVTSTQIIATLHHYLTQKASEWWWIGNPSEIFLLSKGYILVGVNFLQFVLRWFCFFLPWSIAIKPSFGPKSKYLEFDETYLQYLDFLLCRVQ